MGNIRKRTETDQNFVFATKGSTDINFNTEIYTIPGTPDADSFNAARRTQAQTMGVTVWMLGTHKAKEEILRRVALEGARDRYYHNETSYGNYEEQMLSCVKRIVSGNQVMRYELKPGQRKEALDCEGLALHASYAMGYRLWSDSQWQQIERHLTRV
jgi:phage terminase large subunit GpA-like protein